MNAANTKEKDLQTTNHAEDARNIAQQIYHEGSDQGSPRHSDEGERESHPFHIEGRRGPWVMH